MDIKQDAIIRRISIDENLKISTVQKVFKSAEKIILEHLSSTDPLEDVNIKIFNGITIKRRYRKGKIYTKGMFDCVDCPEHVKIKGTVSKYFSNKVNGKLFS